MKERAKIVHSLAPNDGKQILAILTACLISYTTGLLFSWTSPSIPILISQYHFTLEECSYLTILAPVSSAFGGFIYAKLIDAIGRKYSLMTAAIPHIISLVLIGVADNIYLFYLSRLITGIGDACMFSVLPTYVGEISTPKVRAIWGNTIMLMMYFGQISMNASGGYLSIQTNAFIYITFSVFFVCTFYFMPETPYYLIMKGRDQDARNSLRFLRQTEDVEEELAKLKTDVARQMSESGTWKDVFTIDSNRKAFFIGTFMRTAQQLSGMFCFLAYSSYIFQQAGGDLSSTHSAIIFSCVCAVTNFLASFIVDKFGRKLAMVSSLFGSAFFLFCESTYFYIASDQTNIDTSNFTWMPLMFMLFYVVAYSLGLGIIPTLALSELFSASIKGKGACLLNIMFCFFISTTSKLFQVLESNFGMYTAMLFFSVCSVCNGVAALYLVPETKGKTLEEIQQSMKSKR